MPWREMSPVEQRLEFVREYETELFTMTELAAQYGISRKTAYKWIERYLRQGTAGLEEPSRRRRRSPNQTAEEIVTTILDRYPLTVTDGFSRYLLAAKR